MEVVDNAVGSRATAARALIKALEPLLDEHLENQTEARAISIGQVRMDQDESDIISAIQAVVLASSVDRPIFAAFHNGQVHHPLGGAAYAFEKDLIGPLLLALKYDEDLAATLRLHKNDGRPNGSTASTSTVNGNPSDNGLSLPENSAQKFCTSPDHPTRPIVIHAGAQPNNSPHVGTLVVFCYAFLLAQGLRRRLRQSVDAILPDISVEICFVDTAPVHGQGREINGVQYQRCYRDVPTALKSQLGDYDEVLKQMSEWSGIPFHITFQSDFFSQPHIPSLLSHVIKHRARLASQLSPKHRSLALRAACPMEGCAMAEKHGLLNRYSPGAIHFNCPWHGEHSIDISKPEQVARLEANAPTRNLIRSMVHLLDDSTHHVRITGADYAGTYQEAVLYRPLAEWSALTGLAAGRTPHILYAPLVVDWSGAKLSKGLYIRQGGYDAMKTFGTDGLCSYSRLKALHGPGGLRQVWAEVDRWLADPKMMFRTCFSVEYLQRVIAGRTWE